MRMRNAIVIDADPQQIYLRAGNTESWPQILPHYRYVRVLRRDGDRALVEMAAWREAGAVRIPVRWRAEQQNDPSIPQIFFRHLQGWTSGMLVYWRFVPLAHGGTRVEIDHELHSPLAPFIGRYFIDPIATKTLGCIKRACEEK